MTAQYPTAVLQTITNPDGTVSIIQVDPSNPIITLPDGTTAQVQGVATVSCKSLFIHFFFLLLFQKQIFEMKMNSFMYRSIQVKEKFKHLLK